MKTPAIALVGDYSPKVTAHRAIPTALELVKSALNRDVTWTWVGTAGIRDARKDLASFSAVWVVPHSPYEHMEGALAAIRWARETKRPFLGTCGGFQHALIEIARDVMGLREADHAETNPGGASLVVTALACSLVEKTNMLRFTSGSRICAAYGRDTATEGYHCSYGPAEGYHTAFEGAGVRFTAFDETGEIRAAELSQDVHPFFVGTLFQPERAALRGEIPPLVKAFVQATLA
jgi:CTP synthase (UTP-ammonia lyase)